MKTQPSLPTVHQETEHQELFYRDCPLDRPLDLHIPSALGPLGYFVCLRVEEPWVERLEEVTIAVKLTGLRSTDIHLKRGEGLAAVRSLPSKQPGMQWVLLARGPMARGDGTLVFGGLPPELRTADLLFCTWLRFITSGQADDWLACQADPLWAPNGVPLGGIGTGKVELSRDGRFRNFSGNNNQDMPFEEPDGLDGAFLSVTADGREQLLATRPMAGIPPCPRLAAEMAFPQVRLSAPELLPGLDVEVRCSGPLVPQDLMLSSLPVALMQWRLVNRRDRAIEAECRFAWPNLVGSGGGGGEAERRVGYGDGFYRFWEAPGGAFAEPFHAGGIQGLRYGNLPNPVSPAADGAHYLAVLEGPGMTVVDPDPHRGSVRHRLTIPPGGEVRVAMALAWEMPHWMDIEGVDRGLYWQNRFRDGLEILDLVAARFRDLMAGAGALNALLDRTDLPAWMRRRLANCCYPLVTNSVLYRDGRFSINEGPTEMSGCFGTIDQRLGAHPATQLLFPQLNRQELDQFSNTMTPEGEVSHDLGFWNLERKPGGFKWPDLVCSYAIQHARHAWTTGDEAWAATAWPNVRRALERHARWAEAGKGVAQLGHKTGLGTSYDSYHYEGTTAYIGTLWIAALEIAKIWADKAGDPGFKAKAGAWIAAARARLEADLWNGRYYRAFAGEGVPTNENCHGGMLAGEYFCRFLAGRDVLPLDRLQSCEESLMTLNGSDLFAVPPDEVSADGTAGSLYGWLPYIESFCLAPAAVLGHAKVLPVWERMIRTMQGDDKHPCDTRLMYRPATGAQSWGAYYMTAPASWLVYDALLDFRYLPGDRTLRLIPRLDGRFAVLHPLFWAVGWRDGRTVGLRIERCFAPEPPLVAVLETPAGTRSVRCGGQEYISLPPTGGDAYGRCPIAPHPLAIGAELAWTLD